MLSCDRRVPFNDTLFVFGAVIMLFMLALWSVALAWVSGPGLSIAFSCFLLESLINTLLRCQGRRADAPWRLAGAKCLQPLY